MDRKFMAQLLADVLQLDERPVIDWAHRVLRVRPGDNEPPRHLILRVHYCHVFEDILHKITKSGTLTYQGQQIQIFRDFPPAVVNPLRPGTYYETNPGFNLAFYIRLSWEWRTTGTRPRSQTQKRPACLQNGFSARNATEMLKVTFMAMSTECIFPLRNHLFPCTWPPSWIWTLFGKIAAVFFNGLGCLCDCIQI